MATLCPYTFNQWLDNNGDPLAGGKIDTLEAGTSTPKATYTDSTEDTANANPVVLDSNGRADIWLGTGNYKLVIKDSDDVVIDTVDNVAGQSTGGIVTYDIATNTSITEAYDRAVIYCTASPTLSLLPVADATDGFEFWVKNEGSGTVTIDPDASETIDDTATFTLAANEWARVVCDGDEWHTFERKFTFSEDVVFQGKVSFADDGELTIASGAITVTGSNHTIDTESDAATDDLDTINGGVDGMELTLRIEDDAREVVFKDGTGNIETPDGNDITLTDDENAITLVYDAALSKWLVRSTFTAGAGTATTTTEGLVERATDAELASETADKIPDASQLKLSPGVAIAWGVFDGTNTGTFAALAGYNIGNITRNSTGDYSITLTDNADSANYVVVTASTRDNDGTDLGRCLCEPSNLAAGGFDLNTGVFSSAMVNEDHSRVHFAVFGTLA